MATWIIQRILKNDKGKIFLLANNISSAAQNVVSCWDMRYNSRKAFISLITELQVEVLLELCRSEKWSKTRGGSAILFSMKEWLFLENFCNPQQLHICAGSAGLFTWPMSGCVKKWKSQFRIYRNLFFCVFLYI